MSNSPAERNRVRLIAHAISDPGHYTARGDDYKEPIAQWGARAVLIALDTNEEEQITASAPMVPTREEIAILETAGRILGMLASSRGCEMAGIIGTAIGHVRYNAFFPPSEPDGLIFTTGSRGPVFADSIPELIAKL